MGTVTEQAASTTPETQTTTEPQITTEAVGSSTPQDLKPEEASKEDDGAKRFAIIAKRDKKLREREAQLKAKEEQIKAKEAEFASFESDPYGFLEKKGITYEAWTKKLLGADEEDPVNSEVKTIRDEVERLKKEREEEKESRRQHEAQTAWNSHKASIKNIIDTKEDFEFLKSEGDTGVETILSYMVEVNTREGKPPSYEEACRAVESYLEKKAENLRSLKKVQKWFEKSPEAATPLESPKQSIGQTHKPTTLTNDMATQGIKPTEAKRKLTREESLREAAKLIRFID